MLQYYRFKSVVIWDGCYYLGQLSSVRTAVVILSSQFAIDLLRQVDMTPKRDCLSDHVWERVTIVISSGGAVLTVGFGHNGTYIRIMRAWDFLPRYCRVERRRLL